MFYILFFGLCHKALPLQKYKHFLLVDIFSFVFRLSVAKYDVFLQSQMESIRALILSLLMLVTVALQASPRMPVDLSVVDTVTVGGCDSVWVDGVYFRSDTLWMDTIGTDSVRCHIVSVHPSYLRVDSVDVCDSYTWAENGNTYYSGTQKTVSRTSVDGCDSVCRLVLTVRHSTPTSNEISGCDSVTWEGIRFRFPVGYTGYRYEVDTTLSLTNAQGCDGSKHLSLTLYTSRYDTVEAVACDEYRWQQTGQTFYMSGFYRQDLPTTHGCDSSTILVLEVIHSYVHETLDSFCTGTTYQFYDRTLTHGGSYHQDFVSVVWPYCDSIEILLLTELQHARISIEHYTDCDSLQHYLGAGTDVGYHRWSSEPYDPRLDSQAEDFWISVNPPVPTTYTFYADYKADTTCPNSRSVVVIPITRPVATIEHDPAVLTPKRPTVTLRDRSLNTSWREWFVDGQFYSYALAPSYMTDFTTDSIFVKLLAHNDFCSDSDSVCIRVINEALWIPNALTPDQPENNRFVIQGDGIASFSIDIVDRWGIHVFHSDDIAVSWDGTCGGQKVAAGTYMYVVVYSTEAQPHTYLKRRGSVLVIR